MSWAPDPNALRGRIAVVAGATRGAGRGIAAALGEASATVIYIWGAEKLQGGPSESDGTLACNASNYRISVRE